MSYDIEMTIEAVRDIANRTVESMRTRAESTTRSFGDVQLPPAAFGGWAEARALGRHHQGAHEVFVSTLQGVVADLEAFAQNLRDSAASTEQRDEEVEALLVSIGRYQERTLRSRQNYTASVAAVTGQEGVEAGELAAQAEAEAATERGPGPDAGTVTGGQDTTGASGHASPEPSAEAPADASSTDSPDDRPTEPSF
jgi:hypothetical protein